MNEPTAYSEFLDSLIDSRSGSGRADLRASSRPSEKSNRPRRFRWTRRGSRRVRVSSLRETGSRTGGAFRVKHLLIDLAIAAYLTGLAVIAIITIVSWK
jgi:hypothetical protein